MFKKLDPKYKPGDRIGKLTILQFLGSNSENRHIYKCKCDCGNVVVKHSGYLNSKVISKVTGLPVEKSCGSCDRFELIGKKFGKLTVLEYMPNYSHKHGNYFKCKCDCGDIVVKPNNQLTEQSSCGSCIERELIGNKYGYLTVIAYAGIMGSKGLRHFKCKCDCGNEVTVDVYSLTSGGVKSCGCLTKKHPDIKIGDKFGKLTVVEDAGYNDRYHKIWKCKCDCGKYHIAQDYYLKNGDTKSCGCISNHRVRAKQASHTKHICRATAILTRCYNSNFKCFYNYGGRGITCELGTKPVEVAESLSKVPGYFEGAQIDRINNNGNYTLWHNEHGYNVWLYHDPILNKDFKAMGNLRWVTSKENSKLTSKFIPIPISLLNSRLLTLGVIRNQCKLNNIDIEDLFVFAVSDQYITIFKPLYIVSLKQFGIDVLLNAMLQISSYYKLFLKNLFIIEEDMWMLLNPLIYTTKHVDYLKKMYSLCPVDHGWSHIVDVVWNARSICMSNNIPYTKEIEWGCLLHDIGNKISRDKHHEISAKAVYDILPELGVDDVDIELISHCCRYHRASEKEDITQFPIDVQVVSAADRMRPSTNREDILKDVYWRAIQYSMTHTEEVEDTEDPVYSGFKWVHDNLNDTSSRVYSDLYRNTFSKQLAIQTKLVNSITLDEVREWCKREKGIGAEITLS